MAIESQEEFQKILDGAVKKLQSGVKREDLLEDEKEAVSMYEQQMRKQSANRGRGLEDDLNDFNALSKEHLDKGGVRVVRFGDTECSPEDLKKIIQRQVGILGGKVGEKDVFFHAGDMLEDFISFTDLQKGNPQAFRANRIIKDGGLEGKVAQEFKDSYEYVLDKHGVADHQLMGQVSEQLAKGLQSAYYGVMPQFATQKEKEEYRKHFEVFEKHAKSAIRNDAKKKYEAYKKVLEEQGLTPENTILTPGNHDVLDVMYEVLGDYIPATGEISERRGVKFASPFHGSTGAHLGPEFGDVFGYVDISQQAEKVKQGTQAFDDLHKHLVDNGVNYITKKDLSSLFERSQYRASLGVGQGHLAKYMEQRIKPQMDLAFDDAKMKVATKVPKDVDFYNVHGQPNHSAQKGIEEYAFFKKIQEEGGGVILHGHQHGHTTHWDGNTLLLNEGDGKSNFGVYLYDTKKKNVEHIFSHEYNRTLEKVEYNLTTPDRVGVQKHKGME